MTVATIDISEFELGGPVGTDRPRLEYLPINSLIIDRRYQRDIAERGKKNVRKIAENFDWSRFTPLVVSERDDGAFAIIDGQHRTHAAAIRGIKEVPAIVSKMSLEQEAAAFTWINGSTTTLTPNQIFRAALAALEPWAVQADAAVCRGDCQLMGFNRSAAQKKPGKIYCISVVRRFVEDGYAIYLAAALKGIMASQDREEMFNFTAPAIQALTVSAIGAGVTNYEVIAAFLNKHSLLDIERRARLVLASNKNSNETFKAMFGRSVAVMLKDHVANAAQKIAKVA